MKKIIAVLFSATCLLSFLASCDDAIEEYKECYSIGEERCNDNKAQMCNADYVWETFQDCTSIAKICYYDDPSHASGYTDIAVCD